ncbi:NARG2 C domain containing protein [Trichuris trichiura]|uniref:NARG2 C domain containing protein n=1 Tax=Trichuris trichiura TaxID=36087 RepID=A0A077ZD36_TRITR|nr:NARG2 C domain containing protein [Trichuris trichiura]
MVEELPGYKNISIGVQKGDKGKLSAASPPFRHVNISGKRAEENAEEFHQPEMPGRQQCYDLWALKEFTLLVRSNSDGFMRRKDATGIEETCKVSLMPKIEFQPEHGGEVLRAEELRTSYWKLFLKRCNLHVTVRLHYLLDQAIGVETIQPSDFLSKDIYSSRHPWVSDGFNRLHWILRQLSHLDEGAYLLTRDASAHNSFSLYSESADSVNADIRLLDENRERIAINLLDPEDAWLRIDPNVILQWHIIRKHAPAAFDPKETSRGITPLVSVEQKLASGKAGKRKAKTLQSKRRKMRRQKHYANEEMQPMEMAEELPIESDVF